MLERVRDIKMESPTIGEGSGDARERGEPGCRGSPGDCIERDGTRSQVPMT